MSVVAGQPEMLNALGEPRSDAREVEQAAERFEALFLKQLLDVLRKSLPQGTGLAGAGRSAQQYTRIFDQALADELAKAGGIGLGALVRDSMVGTPSLSNTPGNSTEADQVSLVASQPAGPVLPGGAGRLQQVATRLLERSERWAKDAALSTEELASPLETQAPGGVARFNVRDARGYLGYTKCNLFALEMARRAGFSVPVTGRAHGWGYPGADAVTRDAADGRLQSGWAKVVTGKTAQSLDRAIVEQGRAFLLTGSGRAGRPGHMAVVERVHSTDYRKNGELWKVTFDGWEARPDGAQRLLRRTWTRAPGPSGPSARRDLDRIEIIELNDMARKQGREQLLTSGAGASRMDG
ncbi:MAG: rod-binding protein [Proteobacteria bacterium]|nr:rod-binding protein [Pseudomonadota bacterium]